MDIIEKYATKKKIVFLSTIITGIVTAFRIFGEFSSSSDFSLGMTDMDSIMNAMGSMITGIQIVFYLAVAAFLVLTLLSGFYFLKKDKKDYLMLIQFIASALNSVLLLLSVSGINALVSAVRAMLNEDYTVIATLVDKLSAMESAAKNVEYVGYICIFLFIVNIVIFLIVKKVIHINNFEYSLDDDTSSSTSDMNISIDGEKAKEMAQDGLNTAKEASVSLVEKAKAFIKTKNGKIVVGVIALVIVAFGGYKVYDTYFNKIKIDLLPDVDVEFAGESGSGYVYDVEAGEIDYDHNDVNIRTFISSVYYDYGSSTKLENGDTITVHAVYDKEEAERLNIDVTNDTAEVKVTGLIETYKEASEVPDDIAEQIRKNADEEMEDRYESSSSITYAFEFDSMYFAYDKDYSDEALVVYRLTRTTNYFGTEETNVYYVYVAVDDINSAYLDEDSSSYMYSYTLYDSNYDYVTDASGVLEALEDDYDDYKLTKFE